MELLIGAITKRERTRKRFFKRNKIMIKRDNEYMD